MKPAKSKSRISKRRLCAMQPSLPRLARPAHNVNRLLSFRYAKLSLVDGTEAMMPIDFTLTSYQRRLQRIAREFANEILDPLVREADEDPDPQKSIPGGQGRLRRELQTGIRHGLHPQEVWGRRGLQRRSSDRGRGDMRGRSWLCHHPSRQRIGLDAALVWLAPKGKSRSG